MDAVITLDPTAVVGSINPDLFGHFVEHIGRCVYGGIYDPASPRADAEGLRLDVLEAMRAAIRKLVRPGKGNGTGQPETAPEPPPWSRRWTNQRKSR